MTQQQAVEKLDIAVLVTTAVAITWFWLCVKWLKSEPKRYFRISKHHRRLYRRFGLKRPRVEDILFAVRVARLRALDRLDESIANFFEAKSGLRYFQ